MNTYENRSANSIMRSLILTATILSLAACQWTPQAVGKFITAQDRICPAKTGEEELRWISRDIELTARCQIQDQDFSIVGRIRFASHLIYNYSSLEYFRIYAYFMNHSGNVFHKQLLAVNSGHMKPLEDIAFKRTFKLSETADCLAFEYDGKAIDDCDGDAIGWWFSHSPAVEP